jgi:hypothetical protein
MYDLQAFDAFLYSYLQRGRDSSLFFIQNVNYQIISYLCFCPLLEFIVFKLLLSPYLSRDFSISTISFNNLFCSIWLVSCSFRSFTSASGFEIDE